MADILSEFSFLTDGVMFFLSEGGWKNLIMWVIGGLLIFLAIKKDMEPHFSCQWVLALSW